MVNITQQPPVNKSYHSTGCKYSIICREAQYTCTKGVCSQLFEIDVENGIIEKVEVKGGCSGNLQGISRLLVGMKAEDAAAKLEGIRCGFKATSCPDQLSKALKNCI